MQIKFNGTEIDLPGDHPIEIIVHKFDNIEYCKTSDDNYIGIRITKGDRDITKEEKDEIEKTLDAAQMLPFAPLNIWTQRAKAKERIEEDARKEG